MLGQKLGAGMAQLRIVGLIEPGQCCVQIDRVAPQQAVIGGLADQGVTELEFVFRLGERPHQARIDQGGEIAFHRLLGPPRQFRQHLGLEFTADDGGDLGELAGFAQPVETGEQAALEGFGNRQQLPRRFAGRGFGRRGVAHLAHPARGRNRAGHFLDIERDPVGALHHLGQQQIGHRRAMDHVACQFHRLHRIQPVDGKMAHMVAGGAEITILAAGHQQQDRRPGRPLDQRGQQGFGGGIDPVDILHHHDLQLAFGRRHDLLDDGRAQGIELLRRGVIFIGLMLVAVLGDEREDKRLQPAEARERTRNEARRLAPALGRRLAGRYPGGVAHIADPGMQRLVLQIFQALKHQRGVLRSDTRQAFEDQTRLADPRLALDQHALAPALHRDAPAILQLAQFPATADEGRQMLMTLGEAEGDGPWLAHLPDLLRLGEALERMASGVAEGEAALRQTIGGVVDDDGAGRRERLDARGQMQCRTHGKQIRDIVLAGDGAVDDQAGGDPDAHLDARPLGKRRLVEGGDEGAPAGDRLLGVAAERAGRAEIGGETVAGMVGEDAAMVLDGGLAGLVEDAQEGIRNPRDPSNLRIAWNSRYRS